MSIQVNAHELIGTVRSKHGPYVLNDRGMAKSYLFVDSLYMQRGKPTTHTVKAMCFSWGDHPSKIANIFPGDEVKFSFSISGRVSEDRKDKLGFPALWNEVVIESSVEVLNTSQRQLYDNRIGGPKVEIKPSDFTYETPAVNNTTSSEIADDESNDLPF